jgi:serine/threonine-protein kinase HipA
MGRRSHTRALGLWVNHHFVGTWTMSPQGETLHYDSSWLSDPSGRPLSLSLPFTPGNQPHRGAAVEAYFENLLPDSKAIRERVARRYKTDSTEAFDLLEQIGRDCVGALQLLPAGEKPKGSLTAKGTPLSEAEAAQLLRSAVAAPGVLGHTDDEEFRISIAGAQEKTALLRMNGEWCRPLGETPTTHIFKLPMGLVGNLQYDLRDSVENEWLCALILEAFGLPVAACEPLQFEDMKVLAVERFDRRWIHDGGNSELFRLPQEDMCQATGTPPHLKYEADGGPGVDRIMELLNGSTYREQDKRTFFQAQILFWMLCATDGHAKNFSLAIGPQGSYRLTPLYDVLSAYPLLGEGPGKLSPYKAKLAMAVRGTNPHWKMREILRRHWIALGTRHGVVTENGRSTEFVINDLVEKTPNVIETVRNRLPEGFPKQLADSVLLGLHDAAGKLKL